MRRLALLLTCAAAPAQEPQEEAPPLDRPLVERLLPEVTSRLGSDELSSVAWGAYLAGRFRLEAALPDVLKASERDYGDDTRGRLTRLHLLDALVRLDGVAPPSVLASFLSSSYLEPLLILAARQPVANRELLDELFRKHSGMRGNPIVWRVAGNLLAVQQAPGFAAHLMENTWFDLHVAVSDPRQGTVSIGLGREFAAGIADGGMDVPASFPPTPRFHLSSRPQTGDVLLADGPIPVYWRRTERTERRFGVGSRHSHPDARRDHLRWLESMAGLKVFGGAEWHHAGGGGPFLPLVSHRSLVFEDGKRFLSEVEGMRTDMHAAYDRALEMLVEAAVLTSDEARALSLDLRITVHDRREDKSVDLPEVPIR